jgi:predicted O-methyltransferase YrrM
MLDCVKGLARSVVGRFARTELGRRTMSWLALADPEQAMATAAWLAARDLGFANVSIWPEAVNGFEDLAFLFSSNRANMGIASLALDEAAHLFRVVREPGIETIVEIGRFRGGSTFLIAAAMGDRGRLYSYDTHGKLGAPDQADEPLRRALSRYGLDSRVELLVADSTTAEHPPTPCDLVFVDGDHSYAGARADFEHWRSLLRPGGHLLFHDAAYERPFVSAYDGSVAVAEEITRDDADSFRRVPAPGSLAHFVRTTEPEEG